MEYWDNESSHLTIIPLLYYNFYPVLEDEYIIQELLDLFL